MRRLEKLVILGVMAGLLTFLTLSAFAQGGEAERHIRELSQQALLEHFKPLANNLKEGELVLWVKANDTVVVVAHGQALGEVRIPIQELVSSKSFPATFFNPIDDLLQKKLGKNIAEITDIYLLFEAGVTKATIYDYQRTFYHQKIYYCQSCNCCTKEHGYQCCPRTIDMWYVPWGITGDDKGMNSAANALAKLHSVSSSVVSNLLPIVVADKSLNDWGWIDGTQSLWDWLLSLIGLQGKTPPLIQWLHKEFPTTPVVQYDVSYTATQDVQITLQNTKPPLLPNTIVLLIVIVDPPTKTDAERNLILTKVLVKSIEDILINRLGSKIILFATAHPTAASWDVVSGLDIKQSTTDMLIWRSPGPQPAKRLAEVADLLKKDLATQSGLVVHDFSLKLQLLGFLPLWGCGEEFRK